MWTAHPRIKGSRTFPDAYFDTAFYRSDRFLGGAWKSMPVDLSLPRLGTRVLDLQDDISTTAFWYQTLPVAPFPQLPDRDAREII